MCCRITIFLVSVAAVCGVHVISPVLQPGYVAPGATGYIYRSDNNGPASLIQLGIPHLQQPHQFAPPIPLAAQPLQPLHTVVNVPAPLPYAAAEAAELIKPVQSEEDDKSESEEDDEDDNNSAEEESTHGNLHGHGHHGHSFEKGGGSDYGEEHHAAKGEKGNKGYKSSEHHAKGESGHYGKEHNEGFHHKGEGEKAAHHNEAAAHGTHFSKGKSYKGGDQGYKEHFSKGEDVEGYHKVFSKDEFKKDHDFYDVADKSGHFNKHGYEKARHGKEKAGHKKGSNHKSVHDAAGFGKTGFHTKGHHDSADAGFSKEEGHAGHHKNQEEFAKKGGASQEKAYGFVDASHTDDEDYDDEK